MIERETAEKEVQRIFNRIEIVLKKHNVFQEDKFLIHDLASLVLSEKMDSIKEFRGELPPKNVS